MHGRTFVLVVVLVLVVGGKGFKDSLHVLRALREKLFLLFNTDSEEKLEN